MPQRLCESGVMLPCLCKGKSKQRLSRTAIIKVGYMCNACIGLCKLAMCFDFTEWIFAFFSDCVPCVISDTRLVRVLVTCQNKISLNWLFKSREGLWTVPLGKSH